jgi:hypothetical protein
MISAKALALSLQLVVPVASTGVPQLDVEPVCKGIAEQGGVTFRDPAVGQEKQNCIESEKVIRQQVIKQWSSFLPADRTHCITETTMGGLSSYTELLTCLEMARDVRAMRAEAAASAQAAANRASPRSSPPMTQPAAAEPASRPTSSNEPPKREVDSTQKELDKAKADTETANRLEAMARKLADAEAALQRAKEEAGRASEEADQAKTDAQVAQEGKARAERRLADAEAARRTAEGREQACRTAANAQPGLGARLRRWFFNRSEPPNPE